MTVILKPSVPFAVILLLLPSKGGVNHPPPASELGGGLRTHEMLQPCPHASQPRVSASGRPFQSISQNLDFTIKDIWPSHPCHPSEKLISN